MVPEDERDAGRPVPRGLTLLPIRSHRLIVVRASLPQAAIGRMDWPAYAEFCDEDISCFEPEAAGQQVAMRPTRARAAGHTARTAA